MVLPSWQYKQEYEQDFGGILFIPRLRPNRLEGTGPKAIVPVSCNYFTFFFL
jgi:hypothetical protein